MKIYLTFVPPGGGETNYEIEVDLPAIPQAGDYITIWRHLGSEEQQGTEDFIVRRTWWMLDHGKAQGEPTTTRKIFVEAEFAIGQYSSSAHKRSAGERAQHFEATAY